MDRRRRRWMLVTWHGDGLATDDENEIFGHRLAVVPPPDTDPPQTKITRRPPNKGKNNRVKFRFRADEAGVSFKCKLDKKAFAKCTSPYKKKLKNGKHRFKVRARDAAGNVDPTPATDKFKILA